MDISSNSELPLAPLDLIARDALGRATCGVSVGPGLTRIHLLDANAANQQRGADILANFGALTLSATATSLDVGTADPVINCCDQAINADSELAYLVMLDGEIYAQGSNPVSAGNLTLNLTQPPAGDYAIFLWRKRGNFACGSLNLSVNEQ